MRSQLVSVASTFPGADWDLLVRLPGRVVIAATSTDQASPDRAVAAGLAGIDAIASGHGSRSPLVQAVVAAIYSERAGSDADGADADSVLDACSEAAAVLDGRAEPDDREAYRSWIVDIAARVREASGADGPAVPRFLDELTDTLRPRGAHGGVPPGAPPP